MCPIERNQTSAHAARQHTHEPASTILTTTPKICWLEPADPPDSFPDPDCALQDPDGLLAVGGDLSADRLLAAYQRGIFPWYQDDQPILWWSPSSRAVLFPQDLRISRSLKKTLRKDRFRISIDANFGDVITACAEIRSDTGTWITPEMIAAYRDLHDRGHAHSVETWLDDELIGGLYGVNIGRVFFGESMFSQATDASKVALVGLVTHCQALGIQLIDCQHATAHLTSLGSRVISRQSFLKLVARHRVFSAPSGWQQPPQASSMLLLS